MSVEDLADVLTGLVTRLKKVGEAQMLQHAAGLDLSFSQLCILFILDQSDQAPAVHDLAERLGLSDAATGRAVDALVREGLVSRREDEHDRRVKRVRLSDPGDKLLLRLTEAHKEGMRAFATQLTDQERDNLFAALAPIVARPEPNTDK